ncbi:MAG: DUF222 domain-containing protein, partial [Microthrixaceae bacterium]|nr:DUF222 domain-containing protein [Microthrixaceae bacterium]
MFDFIDASGATDLGVRLAEADSRRDPNRELRVPVSLLAGTVADAARLLVERGTSAEPWARPTSSVDGNEVDAADATPAVGNAGDDAPGGADDTGQGADVAAAEVDAAGDADAAEVGDDEVDGRTGVDPADLMEAVEAIGMARRFLAAAESAMIARLEDLESSTKRRGERTAGWLSRSQGVPGRAAAETTRVAAKLDSTFGKFAAALARGEIDHSYCAALVRASNERIEEALVDLQDELLERVAGRRFGSWRRELGAVCALLDTDGPEPLVERDDQLFLSETLDGLVDLKGTFTGSTAEELRQLVEAHTDRLYRQARRDANLTPDLPVPTRTVLRARALLELLRHGSSGEGGAPETHLNLDVEAAPVPGGTESAEPRLHGDQAPRCDRPTHRGSEPHGIEPDGHGDCGGDKHGRGGHGEADNGV